jgi:hypothetical protein
VKQALIVAEGGLTDGAHHKMNVIDQMVRALLPDDATYRAWVAELEGDDGEGGVEYEWDTGISS